MKPRPPVIRTCSLRPPTGDAPPCDALTLTSGIADNPLVEAGPKNRFRLDARLLRSVAGLSGRAAHGMYLGGAEDRGAGWSLTFILRAPRQSAKPYVASAATRGLRMPRFAGSCAGLALFCW